MAVPTTFKKCLKIISLVVLALFALRAFFAWTDPFSEAKRFYSKNKNDCTQIVEWFVAGVENGNLLASNVSLNATLNNRRIQGKSSEDFADLLRNNEWLEDVILYQEPTVIIFESSGDYYEADLDWAPTDEILELWQRRLDYSVAKKINDDGWYVLKPDWN